jgi:hypothetical protein
MSVFTEAVADLAGRGLLPTTLSAAEIAALDAEIRTQAFFSARVTQLDILTALQSELSALVRGQSPGPGDYTNPATVRLRIKQLLQEMDYRPADPDDEGTIKDLRTDSRLNLIIETNEKMATGYGQWLQSTDPDVLDAFPAWEFIRVEDRIEKRDWKSRWRDAAARVGDEDADRVLRRTGRMIARKDSPLWTALSAFGIPQAPFDYNSGMDVRDLGRKEAIEVGLIQPADRLTPPQHPGLRPLASAQGKNPALLQTLLQTLGDEYRLLPDGTLTVA